VIVRFVNIGGIVSHNCLSFLFIVVGLLLYKDKQIFYFTGRPLIHIATTKTDAVGGQSHTSTCSVSSILVVTDITWIKTTASGNEIVIVVGVDGKFSGGTLSDPSLTINNIAKSDEGIYVCRATTRFGTISSEDSVLACKGQFL
jgi:hypothetical protein